jgi:peptidoglycan/LPS O-acetylase OafA/YrhL
MLIQREHTSFNFFRLLSALVVCFFHSFELIGQGFAQDHFVSKLGVIALSWFFTVCGFFISHSYFTSKNFFHFLWKRFLRIQPALVLNSCVLVIICAIVLYSENYPIVATDLFLVFKNVFAVFGYVNVVPNVFADINYTNQFNGSLWTLVVEERLYLASVFLFLLNKKLIRIVFVCITIIGISISWVNPSVFNVFGNGFIVEVLLNFMIGISCYLYKDFLFEKPKKNLNIAGLVFALFYFLFPALVSFTPYYLMPCLLSMCFSKSIFNRWNSFGDYSFSVYIYAWFTQQLIIHFYPFISGIQLFVCTCLAIAPICYVSWHWVEKKALSYRDYFVKK